MASKIPHIDFNKNSKFYYIISSALIVISIVCGLIFGVKVDIQFKGGTICTYSYTNNLDTSAFQNTIETETGMTAKVKTSTSIKTNATHVTVEFTAAEGLPVEKQTALLAKLQETYPDNTVETVSVNSVSPTMGRDFLLKCLVAVVFAALFMIIYIAFRFRKIGGWSAGVFAVVALVHDILMVFATFIIFQMPLDDNFMAVLLVILGYSVNDTIVIYDRVRENEKLFGDTKPIGILVNDSLNQTLSRTINTSVSTVLSMVIVCVFAFINQVDSIVGFAFPLIIGLISGSYSSICLCGPLWVRWQEHKQKKPSKQQKHA